MENVSQDGQELDNIKPGVTRINAKRGINGGEWLIVVFTRNSPCILIPKMFITSFSKNSDLKQVLLVLDTTPPTTVTMSFRFPHDTDAFFRFIKSLY